MKVKIILILIGSILFIQGCAKTKSVKMTAVASIGQRTAYDGTITSQKKHLVSLSPYTELGSAVGDFDLSKYKTIFMLYVENRDKEPINIGFDNIRVIFQGNSKDLVSKEISVQSFDDFVKDFEMLYNDYEKTFIFNNIYDCYILSKIPTGDGAAVERMYDLRKDIKNLRMQNRAIQETLPEYTLKQQTIIEPGNSYNGIVICDTLDLDPKIEGSFHIIFLVDGEEHKFTFNRRLP